MGKSYIACALGHKACLTGYTTLYKRASSLFADLAMARGDGSYAKLMKTLIKTDLLIIDDFGLECLNKAQENLHHFLDLTPSRPEPEQGTQDWFWLKNVRGLSQSTFAPVSPRGGPDSH